MNVDFNTQLADATVEAMREVVGSGRKSAKKPEELNSGIWYPFHYFKALQKFGETKRIDWFQENLLYKEGFASRIHFNKKPTPNGFHFIAKPKVSASLAIDVAIEHFGLYDCGMACQIARYRAIRKIIGDEKFNKLFDSTVKGAAVNIGYREFDGVQPLRLFIDFVSQEKIRSVTREDGQKINGKPDYRPIKRGQLAFITGVREYKMKHWNGGYGNFNVICCDDTPGNQKYLGLGITPEGLSEQKITQLMIIAHNLPANHKAWMKPEHFEILEGMRKKAGYGQFDNHTSKEAVGYRWGGEQAFKADLIWKLTQTPVDQIKPALEKFYPQ